MTSLKSGFVAVAGRPNVGKSTLVNALAGGKVAIVSDKPQTTRRRIAAVVNGDGYQLVLTDLPGFQRPRDALTERMQRTVDATLEDVDAHLLVLAADEAIGITASPCGACRQWLHEFRFVRVAFMHEGELIVRRPDELLPDSFGR